MILRGGEQDADLLDHEPLDLACMDPPDGPIHSNRLGCVDGFDEDEG